MNNKLQIIETPDYILAVSGEEIKDDELFYNSFNDNQPLIQKRYGRWKICFNPHEIIAYQPKNNTPEIDGLPLLPEIVVEDDVENLAENYKNKKGSISTTELEDEIFKLGFKDGHKEATKVYSEEDLRKAFEAGMRFIGEDKGSYDEFIQSLKQPKWFVAEMEEVKINSMGRVVNPMNLTQNQSSCKWVKRLKNTTNSEGKEVLVGRYLNE
mgnify:CR=1 FL=1